MLAPASDIARDRPLLLDRSTLYICGNEQELDMAIFSEGTVSYHVTHATNVTCVTNVLYATYATHVMSCDVQQISSHLRSSHVIPYNVRAPNQEQSTALKVNIGRHWSPLHTKKRERVTVNVQRNPHMPSHISFKSNAVFGTF